MASLKPAANTALTRRNPHSATTTASNEMVQRTEYNPPSNASQEELQSYTRTLLESRKAAGPSKMPSNLRRAANANGVVKDAAGPSVTLSSSHLGGSNMNASLSKRHASEPRAENFPQLHSCNVPRPRKTPEPDELSGPLPPASSINMEQTVDMLRHLAQANEAMARQIQKLNEEANALKKQTTGCKQALLAQQGSRERMGTYLNFWKREPKNFTHEQVFPPDDPVFVVLVDDVDGTERHVREADAMDVDVLPPEYGIFRYQRLKFARHNASEKFHSSASKGKGKARSKAKVQDEAQGSKYAWLEYGYDLLNQGHDPKWSTSSKWRQFPDYLRYLTRLRAGFDLVEKRTMQKARPVMPKDSGITGSKRSANFSDLLDEAAGRFASSAANPPFPPVSHVQSSVHQWHWKHQRLHEQPLQEDENPEFQYLRNIQYQLAPRKTSVTPFRRELSPLSVGCYVPRGTNSSPHDPPAAYTQQSANDQKSVLVVPDGCFTFEEPESQASTLTMREYLDNGRLLGE